MAPRQRACDALLHLGLRGNTLVFVGLGLLLCLLGSTVLLCWAMLFGPPRWDGLRLYLTFTRWALVCYLIIVLFTFFSAFFFAYWDGGLNDVTLAGMLNLVNIGVWLIPGGLILGLIGALLLRRRATKAGG